MVAGTSGVIGGAGVSKSKDINSSSSSLTTRSSPGAARSPFGSGSAPPASLKAGYDGNSVSMCSSPILASSIELPCLTLSTIRHSLSRTPSLPETMCLSPASVSMASTEVRETRYPRRVNAPAAVATMAYGGSMTLTPR